MTQLQVTNGTGGLDAMLGKIAAIAEKICWTMNAPAYLALLVWLVAHKAAANSTTTVKLFVGVQARQSLQNLH